MLDAIFNKDTVDAWIGVFGNFFGTLLAGIISAIIALWTYKKLTLQQEKVDNSNKQKTIETIVEFVDLAIAGLIFIVPGPNGKVGLKHEELLLELNKLKNVNRELANLNAYSIPEDIYSSYLSIKVLLNIIELEVDNVLKNEYSTDKDYADKIKTISIGRRLFIILEHLLTFTDKEYLHSLYEDLKNNPDLGYLKNM